MICRFGCQISTDKSAELDIGTRTRYAPLLRFIHMIFTFVMQSAMFKIFGSILIILVFELTTLLKVSNLPIHFSFLLPNLKGH